MGTAQVSRPTAAALIAVVVLLLGTALWWISRPKGDAAAYSAGVAKLEQTDALKQAVAAEEWAQKNPEAARAAHQATSDKDYQPESGHH